MMERILTSIQTIENKMNSQGVQMNELKTELQSQIHSEWY